MSKSDPLGLRPDDPLERWRADGERREAEFEAERQREERERNDREAYVLRQQFEGRMAAMEQGHRDLQEQVDELARAVATTVDALADKLLDLKHERHDEIGELRAAVAKMDKVATKLDEHAGEMKKTFQFARERADEIVDLPNPLPPRRDIN